MSSSREEVSFYSDCLKLSAYLYLPAESRERRPGIVCCHGYSGMKDLHLLPVPERLAEFGYVCLAFDHRGFGKSEGIRARNVPMEQVRDIRNAITFLQQQAPVDPDRIGLYGISFGGANVITAAALDNRAKCTIAVGAIGDGGRWLKSLRRYWEWVAFLDRLEKDRVRRVMTGKSERVEMKEITLPDPPSIRIQEQTNDKVTLSASEIYSEGYPLENAEGTLEYRPEDLVSRISPRALCLMHGAKDTLVSPDESIGMYERAGEPKRFVLLPGLTHYEVYKFANPEGYERVMKESLAWYKEHL